MLRPQRDRSTFHQPLFLPDILTTVQWKEIFIPQRYSCEQRLLAEILHDAISTIAGTSRCCKEQTKAPVCIHIQQDIEWFASDSSDWPCAFIPLCDYLDLDADAIRRQVTTLVAARTKNPPSHNIVHREHRGGYKHGIGHTVLTKQ